MAYIGNILQKDLADLKSDRLHFATDKDKLSGLKDSVDLGGGETKPQTNTPLIEIYDDGSTEKKIVIE